MQIFIKIGNTITFNVDSSDTVESLKSKIQERQGIPADLEICLVYGSNYLYDGKTLADYKIKNESTIHLVSLRLLSYKVSPTCCTTNPEKTTSSMNLISVADDTLKPQEQKKSKRDLARKLGPESKQIAKLKKALQV